MQVQISKEDLSEGQPGRADSCPIALGTCRAFPGTKVVVRSFTTYVGDQGFKHSDKIKWRIEMIDAGNKFEPFTVEFNEVSHTLSLEGE